MQYAQAHSVHTFHLETGIASFYAVYSLHTGGEHSLGIFAFATGPAKEKQKTEKFIYFFVGVRVFDARRASHTQNDYFQASIELPVCVGGLCLPLAAVRHIIERYTLHTGNQKLNCPKSGQRCYQPDWPIWNYWNGEKIADAAGRRKSRLKAVCEVHSLN